MDFLRSNFFKNEPLISWPFLSSKLDSPVIKTLERHFSYIERVSLHCFDYRSDRKTSNIIVDFDVEKREDFDVI